MYYPLSSGLILFFLFSLFHHLPCASSNQGLGWCGTPFQCGNISAGFPFWGENRSKDCGHPLLELHCNKINITSLFISKQEYSVLNIDQTSNTLTLAKQDLQGSFCSSVFTNTTLPSEIFELSPTYKSVTVFYHCSSLLPDLPSYTCPEIGPISVSVNPRKYPETCRSSFTLKVPKSFVTNEKELNVTNFESVLRKGFEVKVVINENACQECLSSHGRCHGLNENLIPGCGPPSDSEGSCGYNQTSNKFVCYCKDPYSLSCGSTKSVRPWIIGGALILIFIVFLGSCSLIGVIALLLCPCFRVQIFRRRKTSDERKQEKLKALIPLKHYTYKQVKKITKSFAEVVGRGGFGIVYRGTLSNGRMVAVKVLKESKGNNGEDFINEVASMSQTSHVNIVTLLGFCSEGSKRAIIYEFLGNGSLDKFISDKTSMNLDLTALYGIALGVARGLEYLHYGCKTRIVHFDIKPQNVLLDDNLSPKVSDFGLAKLCENKESILSLLDTRGTIGYIAPEMISRVYGSVSHKSDVYSYGMLVLEMIGARKKERVDQHSSSNASSMYFPEWIYKDLEKADGGDIDKVDNGGLMENEISREEEGISKKMTLVGLWCIQCFPSNRPTMNRVVEMMEGSLEALEVPPRPVLQQIPATPFSESFWISEENSSASEILESSSLLKENCHEAHTL